MADAKEPVRKKGLHGWRAAVAVFGCGTVAAFGVFGAVLAVIGALFDVASSGVDASTDTAGGAPAEQIGEARSSLGVGEMNVCDDNLEYLTTINVTRQDSGENYIDTEAGGEPGIAGAARVVRDECLWTIIPSGSSTPWNFEFRYEAIIDADGGESVDDLARGRFEDLRSSLVDEVSEVKSEGDAGLGESSYSVYGTGSEGRSVYLVLLRTRSAIYQIRFEDRREGVADAVSENAFRNEVRKITGFLGKGFEYWIPE